MVVFVSRKEEVSVIRKLAWDVVSISSMLAICGVPEYTGSS
jgi:hypothetical protein